jgi:hypothetical protein
MLLFSAFDDEQFISPPNHNPRMPKLVFLEEERREHVQLECIENSRTRGFVEENYVAGLERAANFLERYDGVTLVPEATALDPSDRPARLRSATHEIILS